MSSDLAPRFEAAGLDAKGAALAARAKHAQLGLQLIEESKAEPDARLANLLLALAAKYPVGCSDAARAALLKGIASRDLKTNAQLDAAIKYARRAECADSSGVEWNQAAFDRSAGVGVVVTAEQIKAAVNALMEKEKATLVEQRYRYAPKLLSGLLAQLEWADGGMVKAELDAAILALLGPRTEEDNKKVKVPKPAADDKKVKKAEAGAQVEPAAAAIDWLDMLNGRELPEARNTPAILEAHKKATGGRVITRFPPEPNGYLHIGHAKAMNFNFGLANKFGGECIMRFDDTNPEAEKGEYIDSILENLKWLGHTPSRVTYSSEYFPELYDLAVKLIKKGKAYVCHQTAEEIRKSRETRTPSPYRERPMEESIKLFEDMRKGKIEEGKATLRMKGDMNASNPQMWDLVAYRIKFCEHPHVGDKWCIYPSYDYTHCIVDSLENITHSCCTLEFEVRRESYYWLLHELDLYKPKVWEFSRLQLEYTVMSKRRLLRLVNDGYVSGWDDPRLSTLNGFRRRGFPAAAMHLFTETIGISRNENFIALALLEHCARQALDPLATRAMVVTEPIKVVLSNYPEGQVEQREAPNHPKDPSKGVHSVPFSRTLWIDSGDFRAVDPGKDFFGLAPGKEVHLKHAYNIRCERVEFEADGVTPRLVHATVDLANANKPKGKINWVAEPAAGQRPLEVELRLYDTLFLSKDPMQYGGEEWINDLNPNSLVVTKALADPSIKDAKPGSYYQFERMAFFMCDDESTPERLIFNRTVTLKESKAPAASPTASAPKKKDGKAK